jgi:peptide/nickel transport system substrate-binding protein
MRWQALIAVLAIAAILALAGLGAYQTTTVLVPDQGGTYREGVAGSPRYVNPLLSTFNDVDRDLAALVFEGLTVADEHGQILPRLAESWEISPDNLTYTFHLRRDAVWHDGTPFTAEDVVFTIDLLRAPDLNGQAQLAELWRMVQVERPDDYTVRFTLDEPFAPFLHYTTLGLLPAHVLKDVPPGELSIEPFNLQPVGTGPFQVGEITSQHALLLANPSYYGGRPYLDSLEFVFYPDYDSVWSAYEQDEVHGISHISASHLSQASTNGNLNLFCSPLAGYGLVFLNLERPIFQEKEVRQALLLATDRERIIAHVLNNQAIIANGPVLPLSWAYSNGSRQYAYDPAAAIALLEKAGWKDEDHDGVREKGALKLEFALLTNDDETRIQVINELTRQWAQAGIRAIPQSAGVAGVVRDFLMPHNYDAILYEWQRLPTDPDPYPQFHSTQKLGAGQNFGGYNNEAADLIMERARQTADPAQRAALYRQLLEILAEDTPAIPLYYPVYCYAVDKLVQNVRVGPLYDYPDRFRSISGWYINTRRVLVSEESLWSSKLDK